VDPVYKYTVKQYQSKSPQPVTTIRHSSANTSPVEDLAARTLLEQLNRTVDYQSRKISRLEAQLEQLAAIVQKSK